MPETDPHPIRLRNGLTRRVEPFVPLDWQTGDVPPASRRVRMYVCGPTVYDRAHLGNARSAVVFDVLFRLLRHVYGEDRVTYVRNLTDIEDKIIARAAETGRSVESITDETIRWYHEDMDALGCLRPTHEPRATQYVPKMVEMTQALIEKGHAYEAEGHVLFAVESYGEYGRLSGRSVEDMIAGARVEVAPFKRSPADFVLWKPSADGIPGWDSPWGRGRPGWHIECSAMARDLLGGAFDIHGGGLDLQFPHHENEIAQSRCAHPDEGFAEVWMHNEMLRVEGEKMSKSLGNFTTVRDLLDRGVPGEVIRLVLMGTHYAKPLDWTEAKQEGSWKTLRNWRGQITGVEVEDQDRRVIAALQNDLNTSAALAALHELSSDGDVVALASSAMLLGLLTNELSDWPTQDQLSMDIRDSIERLMLRWLDLRSRSSYERADAIRDRLATVGVKLVNEKTGGGRWAYVNPDMTSADERAARIAELEMLERQFDDA